MTDDTLQDVSVEELDQDQTEAVDETETAEVVDGETTEVEGAQTEAANDDEGITVTLGDEPADEESDDSKAAPWVRELRKTHRETVRHLRAMEAENARLKAGKTEPAAQPVGEKPRLADFSFDEEAHEKALDAWHERKRAAEDRERRQREADEQQRTQWTGRLGAVDKAAAALRVPDHDEALQLFEDQLSVVQRGIILAAPNDPKTSALLRYALGKNPAKAKALAEITDPVKFTWAAAQLEAQLKVAPRKSAPPPERVVRSSVAGAAAVDTSLQRLRDEAEKTGDFSKVLAYKNSQRAKQKA